MVNLIQLVSTSLAFPFALIPVTLTYAANQDVDMLSSLPVHPCDVKGVYDQSLRFEYPFRPEDQACINAEIESLEKLCRKGMRLFDVVLGRLHFDCFEGLKDHCARETAAAAGIAETEVDPRKPAVNTFPFRVCFAEGTRHCSAELLQLQHFKRDFFDDFSDLLKEPNDEDKKRSCESTFSKQIQLDAIFNWFSSAIKQQHRIHYLWDRQKKKKFIEEDRSLLDNILHREVEVMKFTPTEWANAPAYINLGSLTVHHTPMEGFSMWYGCFDHAIGTMGQVWKLKRFLETAPEVLAGGIEVPADVRAAADNGDMGVMAKYYLNTYVAYPKEWVPSGFFNRDTVLCNLIGLILREREEKSQSQENDIIRIAEIGVYRADTTRKLFERCGWFLGTSGTTGQVTGVTGLNAAGGKAVRIQYHLIDPWSDGLSMKATDFYAGKQTLENFYKVNGPEKLRKGGNDAAVAEAVVSEMISTVEESETTEATETTSIAPVSFDDVYAKMKENVRSAQEAFQSTHGRVLNAYFMDEDEEKQYSATSDQEKISASKEDLSKRVPPNQEGIFIHRISSTAALTRLYSLDLAFIDGDHSLWGCFKDVVHYSALTRSIIAGHDWNLDGHEEVAAAVLKYRLSKGGEVSSPIYLDSDYMWWMTIDQSKRPNDWRPAGREGVGEGDWAEEVVGRTGVISGGNGREEL